MNIANIKNNYLQNIAKSIDTANKPDNNLDIFEFSKFIDAVEPEKRKIKILKRRNIKSLYPII